MNQSNLNASTFVKNVGSVFLEDFKKIIEFFIFCCELMKNESIIKNKDLNSKDENTLNNKLCRFLESNKGKANLGDYYFIRESAEINELTDKIKGYHDIKVIIPNPDKLTNGTMSYIFESKRLNGCADKNEDYVSKGIIDRFINEKYISHSNIAGMIGFIQKEKKSKPTIKTIIENINQKLISNKYSRNKSEKLEQYLIKEEFEYTYKSEHTTKSNKKITLCHLMFDVDCMTS